jgi:phage-related protein
MATTFTGTVLPAVTALASYLSSALFPIFLQVVGIIRDQVLPIVASFATFLYGTVYPAVVAIATAVASNLKPVFDALVATFRTSVLPTVEALLIKFREWQPTIQQVIGVVVKIIGKVLEFASAILGKVLPVVVRFAGFLISTVVPAVANVIGVIAKIIEKVFDFGRAVVNRVADVAEFASGLKEKLDKALESVGGFVAGVREKFGNALDYVKSIPGKIKDAIGDLWGLLYSAGVDLMLGFIKGIESRIDYMEDVLLGITLTIPKFKGPIEKDRVLLRPAGQAIMEGLIGGLQDGEQPLKDKLTAITDTIKGAIATIKSDMASLASSITTAFTGNLFEATTGAGLVDSLKEKFFNLGALKAAFRKLTKMGVAPAFLSQLFASGNSALILDLAAGPRWQAQQAATLFGSVNDLSSRLGNQVASNQYGPKLDRLEDRLSDIHKAIKLVGRDLGRELNAASGQAKGRR